MAPRKLSDDQLEEIRLMLETFTAGLQAALQTTVTTALQTVLHDQHNHRVAHALYQKSISIFMLKLKEEVIMIIDGLL